MDSFFISLLEALLIVLGVLARAMGWRMGVIIGTGLVLTILGTFIVMALFGIDLERMSLGALVVALYRPGDGHYMRFVLVVLGCQIVVGVVGFAFHFTANVGGPSGWWENFLYGAPIFTPLLFPNLAILAALGVWTLARREKTARPPLPDAPA